MTRFPRAVLAFSAGAVAIAGGASTARAEAGIPVPDAVESVVELRAVHSGLCLDLANTSLGNGVRAVQGTCNGSGAQRWRAVPVADSSFEVRSVASGKCLEVENSGKQAGAAVQQWECTGGKQMRWQMVLVDHGRKIFQLRPMHTEDRCLDITGGDQKPGAKAQQWYCNQTDAQLWQIQLVQ